jgi:hypothetical protein
MCFLLYVTGESSAPLVRKTNCTYCHQRLLWSLWLRRGSGVARGVRSRSTTSNSRCAQWLPTDAIQISSPWSESSAASKRKVRGAGDCIRRRLLPVHTIHEYDSLESIHVHRNQPCLKKVLKGKRRSGAKLCKIGDTCLAIATTGRGSSAGWAFLRGNGPSGAAGLRGQGQGVP